MKLFSLLSLISIFLLSNLYAKNNDFVCKADEVKIYASGSGLLDNKSGWYNSAFNRAIIKDYDNNKTSFTVELYYNDYSFWTKEGMQEVTMNLNDSMPPLKENTLVVKKLRHTKRKIFIDILNSNDFFWEQDWWTSDPFGLDPNRYREEATGKCKPCSLYIFSSCAD